ncbi:uncharacterized protein SCODWIG_03912 [Saccharomycodes ludwigii]|uniref:Chromatin modification-related protein EAF3 n=1 Tax=Saccharomycodes ludwigii TaxID=36035 RepID=A0A376BDD5_9ASCO|nr:hypothetical protein SCDLUD_001410 [Saccharomycodes ludwigii]KAH3901643.1 hypothetical protein SCDLUD_001410 [Saccharomycodes ludwigii]SSD62150.1 uncharacterized protein SCODWIG_03912 [Saccharomycodes ludwigii]
MSEKHAKSKSPASSVKLLSNLQVNKRCLAFHGPLLYEAKILCKCNKMVDDTLLYDYYNSRNRRMMVKTSTRPTEVKEPNKDLLRIFNELYYVHYKGWKNTWDEWIGMDRIREYNKENLRLQKSLEKDVEEEKSVEEKTRVTTRKDIDGINHDAGINNKKLVNNSIIKNNDKSPFNSRYTTFSIHLSCNLQKILIEDWDKITYQKKLIQFIPLLKANNNRHYYSVQALLRSYYNEACKEISELCVLQNLEEFVNGILLYFENCTEHFLLYRQERLQLSDYILNGSGISSNIDNKRNDNYNKIFDGDKRQECDLVFYNIYGGVHLLRLLSILPQLLYDTYGSTSNSSTNLELKYIIGFSNKLAQWMDCNRTEIFSGIPYINTPIQYELLSGVM